MRSVVAAVAAIGKNRVLGKENKLLWHIPDDLKRFKELTKGHPVIMGNKTYISILSYLGKPLPDRTTIVVTRNRITAEEKFHQYAFKDEVFFVSSIQEAIEKGKGLDSQVFIGGGAQIYEAALPYTDKLYLTLIDDEKEGDSFFPAYENEFTKVVHDEAREWNGLKYRWLDLQRA
jgi:dihydrofolate reductase